MALVYHFLSDLYSPIFLFDMRGAIDAACSTIDRQIRKNKTRLSKRLRQEALVPIGKLP